MARGGKIAHKSKTRNKVQLGKRGSDESDEDYILGEEEEFVESEDEYCSSLADDDTEESLGEFEEEEEEEELEEERIKKKIKKVGRPRGPKSFPRRKKNGVAKPRKKKVAYSEEEGDDYSDDDFVGAKRTKKTMLSHNGELDDLVDEKPRKRTRVWSTEKHADSDNEKRPRKKTKVSYREQDEDSDYNDSDDDDDDEDFTPDDIDGVDEDEDLDVTKKMKVDRLRVQEARIARGKKRKRNAKASKRPRRKKPTKKQISRRNNKCHDKKFKDERPIVLKKKKIAEKVRERRKSSVNPDSDFASSGSSDYKYTMSEEEREQVREASEFCRRLATGLRSSNSLKMIEEEETANRQGRKGKEKVLAMNIEVGKQVCGICLSEEGKRTVRGILNCCSHYFCFACIMEWSKVESRCPLCKQRFATISRTAREDGGHDLRDAVITVPERDQVYQPTEEELRGYLDPYENVFCTECHQGGDDALMLLCDLCDSPAHTYCVGLGREVPEGNWYCDGCRPTALASSNPQCPNPTPDHGANNNLSVRSSPIGTVRETFDLNELYIPETPLIQVNGHSPSPRNPVGDFQAASPSSGSGAFTLYERRRIQRQIHQLLNNRSRQLDRSDGAASLSGISLFGSQICREVVAAPQHAVPGRVPPQNIYHQGRLPDHGAPSLHGREVLSQ
ncbi:putative E3 ubiquitin ligase [Handroanthus impetiginosus]|uniref:Putative E3 ubiquitin ligase n=1 Tax=Handroanthus impetiginosus TaxID=429701 RepID=A0A2G9GLH5_9LAMI|nr:putative E3 ubiquitin ligase [Handroanthus impetiginosus]